METVAVIDLGSNTARLVLARILPNGHYVIFDELKEAVRLGQDMDRDGFLKPSRVAQAVKTLKIFRKLCDSYNVDKVYAYATNAVRRAKNQKSFIEEINAVCGFKIRVLTEDEEAMHIYYGVVNSLDIPKAVIMDMSGSSLQLIQYSRRNVLYRENLPLGTITLSDLFSGEKTTEDKMQKMFEYVKGQLENIPWLKELDPEVQFIGVGGVFRNLARICRRVKRYPVDMIHNFPVSLDDFKLVYNSIKPLDSEKLGKIKGLSPDRADIFPAALACIRSVFELVPTFDKLCISGAGIREGFLFNHAVPATIEKPIGDILGYSAYTLIDYCGLNLNHANQVCMLAIQLYKQLRVLHKLPRQYVKVLRVAALLHDSGSLIKFYNKYKHTFYFILNSNLYGVTHRELVLAAFVAQGLRKNDFNMSEWNKYKDILLEEDLVAVMRLSVILRIAESLDRSMQGHVKDINCDVLGDSVIMKTVVDGDCSLEIRDAMDAAEEFSRSYKKNLEIL
jgi:exopolyphosphatase/guanosine-5'-triphosphate,3'-diphosphate pyrophosphatase